jgi:hypothetical protein
MFGLGCLTVLALYFSLRFFSLSDAERLHVTLTLLAAVAGITTFLYAQHAQELRLFRELFREFNARYATLNDRLNEIRSRPSDPPLQDPDRRVLSEYFDLCAEEYMYATAGHFDSRVWCAWVEGMRHFDEHPRIREFWEDELNKQKSYYGFTLDCIPNRKRPAPR